MNAASAREPWEGKTVEGKYPLLELLGSGPRGPVFRTEIARPGGRQSATIKLMSFEGDNSESEVSRLRAATALDHRHLIKILDAGVCQIKREPTMFVVMEHADDSLAQVLPSRILTASEADQLLPPLIEALSYLHEKGFVHGRVQPSNILAIGETLKLSTDCVHKIGDTETRPQTSSASYAPPEGKSSPASDIWSLGATLVAALAAESHGQPSEQQLTIVPVSVPEPFRRIARECLRPNPSDRCTLEQIKGWLVSGPIPARTEPRPRQRRGQAAMIVAVFILVVAVALGVRSLFRSAQRVADELPAEPASRPATSPPTDVQNRASLPGAVAERVMPTVPQSARNTIQGKIRVAVRLTVDANGGVTEAKLTSPGPSKYFANLALTSARKWKFKPPTVDGQATASNWTLKYLFGRGGTEVIPSEIH